MTLSSILLFLPLAIPGVFAAGGLVYYLLAIFCAARRLDIPQTPISSQTTGISLLKPLCGAEPELEECLETFFLQEYPDFELLFAMRTTSDPALAVVERLKAKYPEVPANIILTGEPPYANAKVFSLDLMAQAATKAILVITDSDTSVDSQYLSAMAHAFESENVGAVTNLYRGVGSGDLWSEMEAIGMSTEFMAGVVVAERLEGMKFTLGPSMAITQEALSAIGGFAAMKDYLADDFVLGNWTDAAGWGVALSPYVVNHHASTQGFVKTFKHRLRWNRSTRFSRPSGYFGQGFTYGLAWTLILFAAYPSAWTGTFLGLVLSVRLTLAAVLGSFLLKAQGLLRGFWMIPLQDVISFASWLGGFTGREIVWRGERYRLLRDGRFTLVSDRIH